MAPRTALGLTLMLLASACADDTTDEFVVVDEEDLPCSGVNEAGAWESVPAVGSDSGCEWFEYRAGTTYEFRHSLGSAPSLVFAYLSFESDGSLATLISGDPFLLEAQTEDSITIRNGTNQLFWLRLVALPSEDSAP